MRESKMEIGDVRMVLCDVYGTLLDVQPPPADAEEQWQALWAKFIPYGFANPKPALTLEEPRPRGPELPTDAGDGVPPKMPRSSVRGRFASGPRISLEELTVRCDRWVASDHESDRCQGIGFPEVNWTRVMMRALPELAARTESEQAEFIYAHMQLCHQVSLKFGVASFLRLCRERRIRLALVSNAQAYTLRELDAALQGEGCSLADFDSDWNFWSYKEGFSKPDPEVFGGLARRLAERGMAPDEVLMIGDRFDNDIAPARAAGFKTWWLEDAGDGDWYELGRKFANIP